MDDALESLAWNAELDWWSGQADFGPGRTRRRTRPRGTKTLQG
jgi:hypothetical protein